MTVPVSKIVFVQHSETEAPKYYEVELIELQNSGATTMVQMSGYYSDDPKPASDIVIGIEDTGKIMNHSSNIAVLPCPPHCDPPPISSTKLVTLADFLK